MGSPSKRPFLHWDLLLFWLYKFVSTGCACQGLSCLTQIRRLCLFLWIFLYFYNHIVCERKTSFVELSTCVFGCVDLCVCMCVNMLCLLEEGYILGIILGWVLQDKHLPIYPLRHPIGLHTMVMYECSMLVFSLCTLSLTLTLLRLPPPTLTIDVIFIFQFKLSFLHS